MAGGYWYEDVTGVPHGPVNVELIRRLAYAGALHPGSRIFDPGAQAWARLADVPGVDPAFGPLRCPRPAKAPAAGTRLPERMELHPLMPLGVISHLWRSFGAAVFH